MNNPNHTLALEIIQGLFKRGLANLEQIETIVNTALDDESLNPDERPHKRYFEIWSEGYAATGEHGDAVYWGAIEAENFKQACQILAARNGGFRASFDPDRMTFWGCRLFENEAEARRSFG